MFFQVYFLSTKVLRNRTKDFFLCRRFHVGSNVMQWRHIVFLGHLSFNQLHLKDKS